jgi:hypothetical protein
MEPVLLWPKPQSAISSTLDRSPDDFTVVDTGSRYELRRLSELQSDTPILDPFPGHGKHYREFHSHIAASGCRYVIFGLQPCRDVLRLGLCDESQLAGDEAPRSSGPLSRLRRAVVDPGSAPGTETFWRTAAQAASIGIFILLFAAFLDLARAILVPIVSALVMATMFGPISSRIAGHHVPHWLSPAICSVLSLACGPSSHSIASAANPFFAAPISSATTATASPSRNLHATAENGRLCKGRDLHARRPDVDAIDGRSVDLCRRVQTFGGGADELARSPSKTDGLSKPTSIPTKCFA